MSMYLYLFVLDNLRKESRNGSWSWLLDFTKMICWKCWLLAAATLLYSLLEIWDMFWKLSVQAWVVVLVRTMILIVYYIHSNLLRCTIWCPLGLSKVTFFRGGPSKKQLDQEILYPLVMLFVRQGMRIDSWSKIAVDHHAKAASMEILKWLSLVRLLECG